MHSRGVSSLGHLIIVLNTVFHNGNVAKLRWVKSVSSLRNLVHQWTHQQGCLQVKAERDISIWQHKNWAMSGTKETFQWQKQSCSLKWLPIPSPVVSWKDKSGSVVGDKRMRSEDLDAPSVSKAGSDSKSIYSSKMCTPKCVRRVCNSLHFRYGSSINNTTKNSTNKDGVIL